MGVTMMVVISGWHLRVPCITPGNLKTFFDKPAVELPEEHQTMNDIRVWLEDCIRRNRLCYDESNHPTMYVTSDGDQQNLPLDDKICMLRVKKCRVADNNICSAIGVRVKDLFGTHLTETCHMGPEASIYGNAMQSMVSEFSPDFRQMFSNFIYASKKHIEKLHLGMPWNLLENWDANEPPPFAKIFHNKTNNMTEVTSYSIGINIWGLLFLVSMGANTLHPHVVYDMSRNILREILNNAPVSCTPGNHCLVRSFSLHTTNVQRIILSSKNRPKHFIRPMNDLSFAATGVFTYAKNIDKYMPEDVMHCGFLFSIAKTFNCDVLKVPGRLVQCEYEILADTFYSVLNPLADKTGCLIADSRSAMVILYVYEDEEEMRWDYTMWSKHLCKSDFIITPMIFRAGALIYHESDTLGLIIPDENDNNFNRVTGNYTYIIGEDKTPYTIKFTDALKQLVPIGQQLYLDLSDPFFASLLEKVPAFQRDRALCLEVRLNVPNIISPPTDQVFVTYLQQHARNRSLLLNQTITVPVWKISERQIGEVITTLSSN